MIDLARIRAWVLANCWTLITAISVLVVLLLWVAR